MRYRVAVVLGMAGLLALVLQALLLLGRQPDPRLQQVALTVIPQGGIVLVMPDTGTERYFPVKNTEGTQLAWSPNGSALLYTALEGNQPVVQLLDTRSGRTTTISNNPPGNFSATAAQWSPDGQHIAYANGHVFVGNMGGYTPRTGINIASAPDWQPRPLLPAGSGNVWQLVWSSDGQAVIFLQPTFSGGSQVLAVDVSSGEVDLLFDLSPESMRTMSLTADNRTILTRTAQGDIPLEIDLALGAERVLRPNLAVHGSFQGLQAAPHNLSRLWVSRSQGIELEMPDGELRTLDPKATLAANWSPDGAWIVYRRQSNDAVFALYAIRPDGTDRHFITARVGRSFAAAPVVEARLGIGGGLAGLLLLGLGLWGLFGYNSARTRSNTKPNAHPHPTFQRP